jgi:hypothetical protein
MGGDDQSRANIASALKRAMNERTAGKPGGIAKLWRVLRKTQQPEPKQR